MNVLATMPTARQLSIGLLVLRLALGTVFIVHGGQKLFVLGIAGSADMIEKAGIPGAGVIGPLLAIVEPLAGVGIILGLFTRVAALALATDMLAAILLVHIPNGFFLPMGVEFPLMLFAAAVTLLALGPGQLSADRAIEERRGAGLMGRSA